MIILGAAFPLVGAFPLAIFYVDVLLKKKIKKSFAFEFEILWIR